MFNNSKEEKFIKRDDIINVTEQKDSSDKNFIDYTQVDKEKMPKPDQTITVNEQEDGTVDTTNVK